MRVMDFFGNWRVLVRVSSWKCLLWTVAWNRMGIRAERSTEVDCTVDLKAWEGTLGLWEVQCWEGTLDMWAE